MPTESDSKKEVDQQVTMPVCPYCKATMEPYMYIGYYDEFSMWTCDCGRIPESTTMRGAYA